VVKRRAVRKQSPRRSSSKPRARKAIKQRRVAKRKTAARAAATRSRKRPPPKPSHVAAATTLLRGSAAGAVSAIARRLPWAADETDPIVLLETDHRRFEDLLKQGEETTARAVKHRTRLLDTLTAELSLHELIEEQILYPALEPHAEANEIVLEGYEEHHVADLVVKELHEVARNDERWGAKFKVLKENIEHHIAEEERRMFRITRAVLSRDQLRDLGRRMKALKAEHDA
jgi:Hemerythrin HHE cation binding domain